MASNEQLIQRFKDMDSNGDGQLTKEEIVSFLKNLGFDPTFIKNFVNGFDANGDGKITLDEYKAKLNLYPESERQHMMWKNVFNTFDKDGSGKLSGEELGMILQSNHYDKATLEKWINDRDLNHDGGLDYEEFLDFVKNHKK